MKNRYIRHLLDKVESVCWNIGFVDCKPDEIIEKDKLPIRWMKHDYTDRWFADPFVLRVTEQEFIVLVEEKYHPIKRGRIAKLTIDRSSLCLKSCEVVLALDSHLSFPAIFRNGVEVYIYPENAANGKLTLYKYNECSNAVEPVSVLSPEPLTDAIIVTAFGKPYLFSTKRPSPNGNVLSIYSSQEWDSVYQLDDTVCFTDNTARSAGNLFQINGRWIRPAQDCNGGYGKGLVFHEVVLEGNKFSFHELKRFYPVAGRWDVGMHTFNVYEDVTVVDAKQYCFPIAKRFLDRMRYVRSMLYRKDEINYKI
jgi:hypothetical protein